jgi:uncharacterized membrane protein
MSNISLVATICGLIAALSWGSADYFAAKTSKQINPILTSIFVSLATVIFSAVIFLVYPQHFITWNWTGVVYGIGSGILVGTGLLMFYHGLEVGPVSVVSPIGSAYPLVTTLVVVLLLKGHMTSLQITGIILVVLGVIATSGLLTAKKNERRLTDGVIFALLTFVLWGAGFALFGEAVAHIGWVKANLVDVCLEFIAIMIVSSFFRNREKLKISSLKILTNKYILIVACIQLFGLIAFSIGLSRGASIAVITAISSSYPALTIFLAIKHFDEKIKLIPLSGAFITITGIIVLSLK